MSEREIDSQVENAAAPLEHLLQHDKLLKQASSSRGIEADAISAYNVVSGVQQINVLGAPKQPWQPPLQRPRRAEYFIGREAERARLLADLQSGRTVTVCGPGGMGKTALVAEVVWTLAPDNTPPVQLPDGVFFYSFYGRPDVALALEELARTFGEEPLPTPVLAAQRALSRRRALLIFDGTEEANNLEQLLAVCSKNTVLVTSRRRADAAAPAYRQDLPQLPEDEAISLVQAWGGMRAANEEEIKQIYELVGGLPLVLRLIGRYLAQNEEEASEYLRWLREDLLAALDQGTSKWESVPLLLRRSIAKLKKGTQQMLAVIGLLALAPFDREIIVKVLGLSDGAVSQALGELVNYGLLGRQEMTYEVIHPLIYSYAHSVPLSIDESVNQRELAKRVIRVIAKLFPDAVGMERNVVERLLAHAQACGVLVKDYGLHFLEAAELLDDSGCHLCRYARYVQAEPLLQQALEIRKKQLGADHLDIAESLNNIAGLYHSQGRYAEAEPLHQRALEIRKKQLGSDHPNTAASLNNLAGLYWAQNKYIEAELLYKEALEICKQQLGADHSDTATSLNNLAALYHAQGRYAEAELLYNRVLEMRKQLLRTDHPDIATSLHNLAMLCWDQGRYTKAEPLMKRALEICTQQLETDHPTTVKIRKNYAQLLREKTFKEKPRRFFLM